MKYNSKLNKKTPIKVKDLFFEYSVGAKPFLKWVGGKSQLLPIFNKLYPAELKQKKIKHYL